MKRRAALRVPIFAAIFLIASIHAANAGPWYGAHGLDLERRDAATKAGDDFFRYANGTWFDRIAIPDDKPGYSLRLAISDTTEQRLRGILESAAAHAGAQPNDLEGKVGAFYRSFM